jgi:hypothetical protein
MPFDGLYGQDAYFYLSATRQLVGMWTDPAQLAAWLTSAGTPPISIWPLGYHVQMALASALVGLGPASGQIPSLILGTLTPVWAALLAYLLLPLTENTPERRSVLLRAAAGAVSGLAVALSALAVRGSLVVMSDMTAAHWATLGTLLVVIASRDVRHEGRWLLLSGVCLAVAATTRYIYALSALPALLVVLARPREVLAHNRGLRESLHRAAVLLLPVAFFEMLQLAHNLIHPLGRAASPVIAAWSPLNAFGSDFNGPDGHLSYGTPVGWFYLVSQPASPSGMGLPLLALAAIGLLWLVATRRWLALAATAGWWPPFALFYSGTTYENERFVLSYLTPLAVLAGVGVGAVADLLAGLESRRGQRRYAQPLLALLFLSVLAGFALQFVSSVRDYKQLVDGKNDYLAAARCVSAEAGGRGGPPVFSFGVTFTLGEYTSTEPRELFFEKPTSIDAALAKVQGPLKGLVVLQLAGFNEQWAGFGVARAYDHLRDDYRLEPVACTGTSFNVFRILNR